MDRRDVLMAGSGLFAANLLPPAASGVTSSTPVTTVPPALRTVKIRDVVIGEGRVKAIVPITGATADEAIAQARIIGGSARTDVVEFRVDFLDIALDARKLAELGPKVAAQLNGKPLIVTFRTKAEGGNATIADADYGALYETLLKAQFADLIDVEMFRSEAVVRQLLPAQAKGARATILLRAGRRCWRRPPRRDSLADLAGRMPPRSERRLELLRSVEMSSRVPGASMCRWRRVVRRAALRISDKSTNRPGVCNRPDQVDRLADVSTHRATGRCARWWISKLSLRRAAAARNDAAPSAGWPRRVYHRQRRNRVGCTRRPYLGPQSNNAAVATLPTDQVNLPRSP
jgi:hypothetical protein